ncbi:MAG TPA: ATP-binding protein [Bacteroidales bacterium]|nr:ATP-binding protein [Bacteroidales bacterium]
MAVSQVLRQKPNSTENIFEERYRHYLQVGNGDSVLKYGDLIIGNYQKMKKSEQSLELYSSICQFLLYRKNLYYKQIAGYLDNYLKLAEKTKNDFHIGKAYMFSSDFLIAADINRSVALEYLNKSLEIFIRINNQYHISVLYYRLGDYYIESDKDLALECFQRSVKIKELNNLRQWLLPSYRRIAEVYRHCYNDYDNSRLYYDKALKIAIEIENPNDMADILTEFGCLNLQYNKTDSVLKYYIQAYSISRSNGNQNMIDNYNSHMGVYYERIKEYKKALYYYSQLTPDFVVQHEFLPHSPLKTGELYEKIGDFPNAAKFYRKYIYLKDSLQNLQKVKDIAKLELKFEIENIENESKIRIEKQKTIRNLFVLFSFLLLVVIYLLFRNHKIKQQMNKKLHETDLMKLRFFTNISHDFRTPLTLIISPLKRLIEESTDADSRKLPELMLQNANKLKNLINQLLDISKIEQGNFVLDIGRYDFNLVLKKAASMFYSLAEDRQINYQVFEAKENLVFDFDNNRIEQVLCNLLSNSFKYTPKGGTIIIKVAKKNNNAILTVKDTGIGILQEDLGKVFNRFYQSGVSVSGNYEGNGIGLSIVKEYIELHKGNITVRSEINKGTEFIIEIPLSGYEENATLNFTESYQNDNGHWNRDYEYMQDIIPDKHKETILIVEDNKDLRSYLSDCLSIKYNVIESENGNVGIEKAVKWIPDIIISDIMMPEIDGYQLLARVKSDVKTNHIPVILLTARVDLSSKMEGLKIGADDYLSKPFDEKELLLRIQNILQNRNRIQEKLRLQFSINPTEVFSLSKDEIFLRKLVNIVEDNLSNTDFDVEQLSSQIGLSRQQLFRKLKALVNQSPNQFIRLIRLKKACQLLKQNNASISEIAFLTGFDNLSYFTRKFKEEFKILPSDYLKASNKD